MSDKLVRYFHESLAQGMEIVTPNQASKKASNVLVSIIGILALPMVVLCVAFLWEGWTKIRTLDNELIGVEIAKIAYPALTLPQHKISTDDLVKIQQLETILGIAPADSFIAHAEKAAEKEHLDVSVQDTTAEVHDDDHGNENNNSAVQSLLHDHENNLGAYLHEISERSGLILDNTPYAYYLSSAMFQDLPTTLLTFEKLAENKAQANDNHQSDIATFAHFHNLLGASVEAVKAFDKSINSASASAANQEELHQVHDFIANSNLYIEKIIEAGGGGKGAPASLRSPAKTPAFLAAKQIFAGANNLYGPTIALIQSNLESRRLSSLKAILGFLGASIISAIAALILATKLIRTTLIKLDIVENSHAASLRLSEDLETKITELKEANSEIIRMGRMEQLGQLTATVAHELRNPLGAVRTSAFLIKRKIEGKNVGIDAQIARIEAGILRCDNTITQLLDYSRSRKIDPSNINLDDWLVNVVTEEANRISASIKIECNLGLGETQVPVDMARLQRLVTNLLSNAAEALLQKNSGNLSTIVAPQIWISTRIQDAHAVIQVKDNGPGISEENLMKIREPLFTTKNFGTGLGIPAIEQIAAQHGGRLEISSVLGEGAIFETWLPLETETENSQAA